MALMPRIGILVSVIKMSDSGAIASTPVAMVEGVISRSSTSTGLEEHFEWVHEDVLSYHSDLTDFEVKSLSQQEEWVHGSHASQFALTHCSPSERVCHVPKEGESDFIYMYETILLDLGVSFPLDHFTAEVLRMIGIVPSQLHPNRWAALQAFKVLCQALMVTPFASVFLNHYTIRVGKKVGWVSLAPLSNTSLFTTYTTSYKGFKNRFLKITALGEMSFCSDRQPLPLYWKLPMRDQLTPKGQLSSEEKAIFQHLDELPRGMNCRELVALIGEDPQEYMRSVLKKKGLDMDELIRKAKGILPSKHVSTQKELNAAEAVLVSSSVEKELATLVAEKESTTLVAEKESTIPVAEKVSTVPIAEKESATPVAEELVLNVAEQESAPIVTEKLSASLIADEGPVQTSEGPIPEVSNKRKANTPIVEEVPGKKGKGAMPLSLSPGQPKGKVVVTSGPKLPPGGLSCYTAPSGIKSLWGSEVNVQSILLSQFIPQYDRGLLVATGADNTFDMMAAYHVHSLASLEVWKDLAKRAEQIMAKEALNKKEFEKMAKAYADLRVENDRNKAELAKLKADREGLWTDLAASKSKTTVVEAKMMKWKTKDADAEEQMKSLKDKHATSKAETLKWKTKAADVEKQMKSLKDKHATSEAETLKWKTKATIYEDKIAKLKTSLSFVQRSF
ncbi:hypothetical protein CR513_05413, partial [Mucuna pruriens]